ncbi:MAG: alpha/beta fold hydrolase [Acidimicrobiales bacterium]
MDLRQESVNVDGFDIAYLAVGDAGPLAVCLHGFPDSAWTWRHLLPALADAGFRAVAPWLRGYAPTGVPPDGRAQIGASVADVAGLHAALGGDSDTVVIGHDWGARIATGAAVLAPDKWRRVVTMAVPPAGAVAQSFLTYDQLRRSWYMFFFQTPFADIVVPLDDLAFVDRLWGDWSPGYGADQRAEDVGCAKDSLRDPACLAVAIGYYRATLSGVGVDPALAAEETATNGTPPQPHLYLHGADDGCMGVEIARRAPAHLPHDESRYEEIAGAGHFLQLEKPEEVNRLVVEFVQPRQ